MPRPARQSRPGGELLAGPPRCPSPCGPGCMACGQGRARNESHHHWIEINPEVVECDYRCRNCGAIATAWLVWNEDLREDVETWPTDSTR